MRAATKLYDEDRFTRDEWHAFTAVRRQLDRDRVEVLFLQRNVLNGVESDVRYVRFLRRRSVYYAQEWRFHVAD